MWSIPSAASSASATACRGRAGWTTTPWSGPTRPCTCARSAWPARVWSPPVCPPSPPRPVARPTTDRPSSNGSASGPVCSCASSIRSRRRGWRSRAVSTCSTPRPRPFWWSMSGAGPPNCPGCDARADASGRWRGCRHRSASSPWRNAILNPSPVMTGGSRPWSPTWALPWPWRMSTPACMRCSPAAAPIWSARQVPSPAWRAFTSALTATSATGSTVFG